MLMHLSCSAGEDLPVFHCLLRCATRGDFKSPHLPEAKWADLDSAISDDEWEGKSSKRNEVMLGAMCRMNKKWPSRTHLLDCSRTDSNRTLLSLPKCVATKTNGD